MADLRDTTIMSRRALMATSVGLVGANVAAAAIAFRAAQAMAPASLGGPTLPPPKADAELVYMCRRWIRLCRVYEHATVREDLARGPAKERDLARGPAKERLKAVCEHIFDKVEQPPMTSQRAPQPHGKASVLRPGYWHLTSHFRMVATRGISTSASTLCS